MAELNIRNPSTGTRKSAPDISDSGPQTGAPKVGLVSLGCPKALVDSERIVTQLRAEGYALSPDYEGADVVIVNTCGFLDSAKAESLDAIGEAIAKNGKVIVTGCLGVEEERIRAAHPGVLSVSGPHQYEAVVEAVHDAIQRPHEPFLDLVPPQGLRLTPRHYSYLKISEGCNNRCTFCIIPSIRGDLVSRPAAAVLYEAERLVKAGVKELLVISQDTSAYGVDMKYAETPFHGRQVRAKFYDLCKELGDLGAWVRLHYVYPYPHVDDIMPLMAEGKVLPYLDIPFQHASPKVLKAMKRPGNQEKTLDRIKQWKRDCPPLVLRSTFIVGFPGETDEDFEFLLDWLREAQLDRVGCFKYENVEGAPSKAHGEHVPEELKQERFERFMKVQARISAKKLQARIGDEVGVLIDSVDSAGAVGRSYAEAPEVDGVIRIPGLQAAQGDIMQAVIVDADEHDLVAQPVGLQVQTKRPRFGQRAR